MTRWLAALLLASAPGLLLAQTLPPELPAAPSVNAALAAFVLEVNAPQDIRELLERHLELLRYRELTDLDDGELARLLLAAEPNARQLVATLGYFAPDIRFELLDTSAQPGPRKVRLTVTAGEPTLITEVKLEFQGDILTSPLAQPQRQQIKDSWLLQPGMRFTQARWAAAKQQALRQLTTQRYPAGDISVSVADVDPVTHSASLAVTLDSGALHRLGPLQITGLTHHSTELVTRLARLPLGAEYGQTQLLAAQQRLMESGYFDSAYVSLDTTSDPAATLVRVQLVEARLQKLVLGVGASTDTGARLSVEHTHHQVPGLGWRAVSKLLLEREARTLGTELTAPPDADNWRWVVAGQLQNPSPGSLDASSQRLRAGRSQSGERIDRNYYLQFDRADNASTTSGASETAASISANYAFTLRNFDSLPFPGSGWGLGVELGGGTTLGGQRDPYGRVLARGLGFWPLGAGTGGASRDPRLALRAELGAVLAKDSISLPSTQLFLTGGDSTVRGYGYRDLGVTQADGTVSAGRYLAVGSVEWQQPLMSGGRLTEWEGTLFVDAGAVANQPGNLRAKVGVGVGARWKSPVGPLQIDLAYGVAVKRLRLHLNVGFSF
jgi:translocation and assembly module TamA